MTDLATIDAAISNLVLAAQGARRTMKHAKNQVEAMAFAIREKALWDALQIVRGGVLPPGFGFRSMLDSRPEPRP